MENYQRRIVMDERLICIDDLIEPRSVTYAFHIKHPKGHKIFKWMEYKAALRKGKFTYDSWYLGEGMDEYTLKFTSDRDGRCDEVYKFIRSVLDKFLERDDLHETCPACGQEATLQKRVTMPSTTFKEYVCGNNDCHIYSFKVAEEN